MIKIIKRFCNTIIRIYVCVYKYYTGSCCTAFVTWTLARSIVFGLGDASAVNANIAGGGSGCTAP